MMLNIGLHSSIIVDMLRISDESSAGRRTSAVKKTINQSINTQRLIEAKSRAVSAADWYKTCLIYSINALRVPRLAKYVGLGIHRVSKNNLFHFWSQLRRRKTILWVLSLSNSLENRLLYLRIYTCLRVKDFHLILTVLLNLPINFLRLLVSAA